MAESPAPSQFWINSSLCLIIINAVNNFLKTFKSKVLTEIQDKNIYVITKQLYASVVSLYEVGAFPDETYGEIQGFTKCSTEDFKTVFQHLLLQEKSSLLILSPLQPHHMVSLLLLNLPFPKSIKFFMMPMIQTTTL